MAKIGPKQHLNIRELREKWRQEARAKFTANSTPEPPAVRTDGKKVRHKTCSKLASPTSMQRLNGIPRKKKKLDDDHVQVTSLKNLDSLFEEMKSLFGETASAEETPDIEDAYSSLESRFPTMLMTPPGSHQDIYTLVARKKDAAAAPSSTDNSSSRHVFSRDKLVANSDPGTTSDPSSLVNSCDTPTRSAPSASAELVTPPQTPEIKPQLCIISLSVKNTSVPCAVAPSIVQTGSTSYPVKLNAVSPPDQVLQRKRSRNISVAIPDNTTKLSPTNVYASESLAREQAVILAIIARRNSERTPSLSIKGPEDIRSELHKPGPCSYPKIKPNSEGTPSSSIEPPGDIRSESRKPRPCSPKIQPVFTPRSFAVGAGVSRPKTARNDSSNDTRSEPSQLPPKAPSSAFSTQPRISQARSLADKDPKVNIPTGRFVDDSQARLSLGILPSQTIATDAVVNEVRSTAFATNTKTGSSRKPIDFKELREVPQNRSKLHIPPRSVQLAAIDQHIGNPTTISLASPIVQKSTFTSVTIAASVSKRPVPSMSTISSSLANPFERAGSGKKPEDQDFSTSSPKGSSAIVGTRRKRSTSEQPLPIGALEDSIREKDMAKTTLPADKASRSISPLRPRRSAGTITTSPPIRDKSSEPRTPVGTCLRENANVEFAPLRPINRPAFIFGSSSQGPTTLHWPAPPNVSTTEATKAPADEQTPSPELVDVFDYFRKRWTAGDDHLPYTPLAKEKAEKAEMSFDGNGESVIKKEVKKLKKRRALSSFWR